MRTVYTRSFELSRGVERLDIRVIRGHENLSDGGWRSPVRPRISQITPTPQFDGTS